LLRRCLQKDRNRRLHSAADARIEIEEAFLEPERSTEQLPTTHRNRERLAWVVAAMASIAVVVALAVLYFRRRPESAESRVDLATPSRPDPISFAISPDGRRLVFVASGDGQPRLWLRPFDVGRTQVLAGTEGASFPFWSPDGRSVAFFAGAKLKRIDIGGGP